jgi:hypothetical protein
VQVDVRVVAALVELHAVLVEGVAARDCHIRCFWLDRRFSVESNIVTGDGCGHNGGENESLKCS